jgi:EAL domain-containing protein (putative c-di-GMP-specific phosphodiesterase class I)
MGSLKKIFSKRFSMQFQPIVDMKSLQLERYEALMRPLGFVDDTEKLIKHMERSGEISEFDLWVIDNVMQTLSQLTHGPEVAINLSAKSLCDPLFHEEALWLLSKKPKDVKIEFEITESEPIRDMRMARTFVDLVKAQGCKVGLDDFGTGHARLSVVESLNLDYLKLSARLTTKIKDSAAAQRLIITAAKACHSRNMTVVAEHIDDPMQYAWLRDVGIDHGQGWLFSKAGKELRSEMCYRDALVAAMDKNREGKLESQIVVNLGQTPPI